MGREKRNPPAAAVGGPKERHKRARRSQYDPKAPVPEGLVAKPAIPKSKYHSYFEFVHNKDKKKKLERQITSKKTPPPGFEFVPTGNPELTKACKELSREKDAMIFIVSNSKEQDPNHLAHQVHRTGHHVRETIVDEARAFLGQHLYHQAPTAGGPPEPIPESQEEYNAQVDAAIRDLFPRIPNTDRQEIIEHAFRRGSTFKGDKPVGLSEDITLARRVQLAVLAHIRHSHTRYDTLLKETTWQNARKVVESLCLDTLVKWRGDEENGRDQLDEILREVVVISDSEDEGSDPETDESSVEEIEAPPKRNMPSLVLSNPPSPGGLGQLRSPKTAQVNNKSGPLTPRARSQVKKPRRKTSAEKKGQRGFKRYQNAWQDALRRYRDRDSDSPPPLDRTRDYPVAPAHTGQYVRSDMPDERSFHPPPHHPPPQVAGSAPNQHGFVSQVPPHFRQPNPIPPRQSYSPLPRPAQTFTKGPSPMHDIRPGNTTPLRPLSLAANRLQPDMLVRSVEAPSPDSTRPSFIRTLPPRRQDALHQPPGSPRVLSPSTGMFMRDEPVRRMAQDRPTAVGKVLVRFADGQYGEMPNEDRGPLRESFQPPPHNSYQLFDAAHRSDRGPYDHAQQPLTRVPVQSENTTPGFRPQPRIMENRGGFYERVPVTEVQHHGPQYVDPNRHTQAPLPLVRGPQGHHVEPWYQGPQHSRDRQNGVQIMPITGPSHFPPAARQRAVLAEPIHFQPSTRPQAVFTRGPLEEPGLRQQRGLGPDGHIVRLDTYDLPPARELRLQRLPASDNPETGDYRDGPSAVRNQYINGAAPYPRPQQAENNVIILE